MITQYSGYEQDLVIPSAIDGHPVTGIGKYAFTDCSYLISVKLPAGVSYIDDYAFSGCTQLQQITIPNEVFGIGASAFRGCEQLTNVQLPTQLMYIGNQAFSECHSLRRLEIPENVEIIAANAFSNCSSLIAVDIKDGDEGIPLVIGERAFYGCTALREITMPYRAEDIQEEAFMNCRALETVNTNMVSQLGDGAFSGCTALRSIHLSMLLEKLPTRTFANCTSLQDVYLPMDMLRVESDAFKDCTGLKSITINETMSFIDKNALPVGSRVTICAPQGSYAQRWAHENGYAYAEDKGAVSEFSDTTMDRVISRTFSVSTNAMTSKGWTTFSWIDSESQAPYSVRYTLYIPDSKIKQYTYNRTNIQSQSVTVHEVIPGCQYKVEVTDKNGTTISEYVNVPDAPAYSDGTLNGSSVSVDIESRYRHEGETANTDAIATMFYGATMADNMKNKGYRYLVHYRVNTPRFTEKRTYNTSIVYRAPSNFKMLEAFNQEIAYVSSNSWTWTTSGINFFLRLLECSGTIPLGRYYIDLYWDGMYVNTQSFEVK